MPEVDLAVCRDWFRRNRRRSRTWFDLLTADAYAAQPIALRHPFVFYEGHVAAFNVNTLVKLGLGRPGVDAELEELFERGIDPDEDDGRRGARRPVAGRRRARVLDVRCRRDRSSRRVALRTNDLLATDHPVLRRGLAVFTILEHEAMHHETLLYMFHRLPHGAKRRPPRLSPGRRRRRRRAGDGRSRGGPRDARRRPERAPLRMGQRASCAHGRRAGLRDRRLRRHQSRLPRVRRRRRLRAIPSLWTPENWDWRKRERPPSSELLGASATAAVVLAGLFDEVPLPPAWPVYVSHAEAAAFARWKGETVADRGRVSSRGVRDTRPAHERAAPLGRRGACRPIGTATSASATGTPSRSARIRRAPARGACTT